MLTPTDIKVSTPDNWNGQKDKLKVMFPALTDEDLQYKEGKRDDMITRLQVILGKTNEEMGLILSALIPSRKLKNR